MDIAVLLVLFILGLLVLGLAEFYATRLLSAFSQKLETWAANRKFRFHLSTGVFLVFLTGGILALSIGNDEGGRRSYVGWPLPAKTIERDEIYSVVSGTRVKGLPHNRWNALYIVLNSMICILALLAIGYLLEFLIARSKK